MRRIQRLRIGRPVASAIFTDAGGVLSQRAVVASNVATVPFPDGALITVDGNGGTVTIRD